MSSATERRQSYKGRAYKNFRRALQRFSGDRKGNVAIMFAGAFVPVVAVAGMTIDYAQAQRIQTIMQTAADAASMAAATAAAPTTAQRITIATNVFDANAKP